MGGRNSKFGLRRASSRLSRRNSRLSQSGKMERNSVTPKKELIVALFAYDAMGSEDISMRKGDLLRLIEERNNEWWLVENLRTTEQGLVPRTFVAKKMAEECEEWFAHHMSRPRAERLLLGSNLPVGAFLIRERSGSDGMEFALSVRVRSEGTNVPVVFHYRIKRTEEDDLFFVAEGEEFRTLQELVDYYSQADIPGMVPRLTFAVAQAIPRRPSLAADQTWECERSELQLLKKLGGGNFGTVYYGRWRGVVEVAIKSMKAGNTSVSQFLQEAAILKRCDHPNLVKLYAVCTKDKPLYIVTEFMPNGSLSYFCRTLYANGEKIALEIQVDWAAQIASGMAYLEDKHIVHRDLAARNVLVGELVADVPIVKIADFGLARALNGADPYLGPRMANFPIKWTAPEAVNDGHFTTKSDVWSYGVLVYEIFSGGKIPYPGVSNREIMDLVPKGYRMQRIPEIPEPVYVHVMLKCFEANPRDRPTFAYFFSYFEDYFVTSQPSYVQDKQQPNGGQRRRQK
ncbi:src-1 [Pristionchus pacificus]|uniref:Tyrosine-protein kinase n=1 Tax=Pristionchus pacificus TaxID=54126 RepID=A0A2A6BKY1_PRIPA|nr:src-1 [Pristionchus pacificus]|eukprot:PDM66441.1 src-1 [Pristionchus pacificus]